MGSSEKEFKERAIRLIGGLLVVLLAWLTAGI